MSSLCRLGNKKSIENRGFAETLILRDNIVSEIGPSFATALKA